MNQHENPKTASLRVVTANRLRQGDVVYLTVSGTWSHHLNESRASADKSDLEAMLAKAADDVAARLVVGPYAFEVVEIPGIPPPPSARAIIRPPGPTVRSALPPDPAHRHPKPDVLVKP